MKTMKEAVVVLFAWMQVSMLVSFTQAQPQITLAEDGKYFLKI
jgi:hypothetical protein